MTSHVLHATNTLPNAAHSPWIRERWFFGLMAAALMLVVITGFGYSTYVRMQPGSTAFGGPTMSPLVRFHAAVSASWMLLLLVQTSLIASRRTAVHRRLGIAGGALAAAVIVFGWIVAIDMTARGQRGEATAGPGTLEFLIFPVEELVVFTTLIGVALYVRRKPNAHKRLMMLGTIALIPAATTRPLVPESTLMTLALLGVPEAIFIAALMLYDMRANGRLHAATIWGGGFLLLCAASRTWISGTHLWLAFARAVTS
jgi:hypothetical protein